jgi:exodeoxyribonuclease VII small subunit
MRRKSREAAGKTTKSLSFEEALERLEEIVGELEEGKRGLEDSIRLYEEGRRLVRLCTHRLDEAQTRIEKLVKAEGGFETDPAEAGAAESGEGSSGDGSSRREFGENDLPF